MNGINNADIDRNCIGLGWWGWVGGRKRHVGYIHPPTAGRLPWPLFWNIHIFILFHGLITVFDRLLRYHTFLG